MRRQSGIEELSHCLLGRIERPDSASLAFAESLARGLYRIAELAPRESAVVLGGSFARGEPYLAAGTDASPLSDVDILVVHSATIADRPYSELSAAFRATVPQASVYCLRSDQASHLTTALGREYRTNGLLIGPMDFADVDAVVDLNPRDALELAVFALVECLETGLLELVPKDAPPGHVQYLRTRVALNMVRSVVMLDGGFALHDGHHGRPEFGGASQWLLRLRDNRLDREPVSVAVVLRVLMQGLAEHRRRGWLTTHPDAITGSLFESAVGGRYVGYLQRLVLDLFDQLRVGAEQADALPDEEVARLLRQAWRSVCAARPELAGATDRPWPFFAARSGTYRDQLLQMKL
ncbi:nucleotidyltransferase domain-containing protein [Streptomyces sp. RGM 3693]|uniref:nucleotidyltransferase domain-containing protein n=1 Tax=Streptomyces sp. RGM 3693 TaxID=3413284 RepID=UPI003D2DB3C5